MSESYKGDVTACASWAGASRPSWPLLTMWVGCESAGERQSVEAMWKLAAEAIGAEVQRIMDKMIMDALGCTQTPAEEQPVPRRLNPLVAAPRWFEMRRCRECKVWRPIYVVNNVSVDQPDVTYFLKGWLFPGLDSVCPECTARIKVE